MENEIKIGCHDSQADRYDAQVRKHLDDYIRGNYFDTLDHVVQQSALAKGQAVLDIGIGTGLLTERMSREINLYGIDISGQMMKKARSKDLNVTLSYGCLFEIPFRDRAFDRIVSTFAFHHLRPEEKGRAYTEMDRVLKPGGIIVIGDFMVENDHQKRDMVRKFENEKRHDMIEELDEEFFLDISHDAPILEQLGYKVAHARTSTLTWALTCMKTCGTGMSDKLRPAI